MMGRDGTIRFACEETPRTQLPNLIEDLQDVANGVLDNAKGNAELISHLEDDYTQLVEDLKNLELRLGTIPTRTW